MIKRFPNEDAPIWTGTYHRSQSINCSQKKAKQQSINQSNKKDQQFTKNLSTELSIQGRQDSWKQRRPSEHGEELLNDSGNKSGLKPCENLIRPNRANIGHFSVHRGYRFKKG